jgi:hypothetical protein
LRKRIHGYDLHIMRNIKMDVVKIDHEEPFPYGEIKSDAQLGEIGFAKDGEMLRRCDEWGLGTTRPDGWYFDREMPSGKFVFEVIGGPFPTQEAARTALLRTSVYVRPLPEE